ncbi:LLM class flavin-dependent oxidoreductase [Leucobacter soli]|uniref:LLM class flavin-dependent oxidoreductase n=1 Tax=Leucobacter soli TaxID=2812850 RepID=UPI00360EFA39
MRANRLGKKQELTVLRATFVSHSEEEIEQRIDEALINHRINQRLHHFIQNADESGVVRPDPLDEEPSRAEVRENLLFGTPEEVIEKLRAYEAIGVDQIMTTFDFGPEHAAVARSMRLFADEVIAPMRSAAK